MKSQVIRIDTIRRARELRRRREYLEMFNRLRGRATLQLIRLVRLGYIDTRAGGPVLAADGYREEVA